MADNGSRICRLILMLPSTKQPLLGATPPCSLKVRDTSRLLECLTTTNYQASSARASMIHQQWPLSISLWLDQLGKRDLGS